MNFSEGQKVTWRKKTPRSKEWNGVVIEVPTEDHEGDYFVRVLWEDKSGRVSEEVHTGDNVAKVLPVVTTFSSDLLEEVEEMADEVFGIDDVDETDVFDGNIFAEDEELQDL